MQSGNKTEKKRNKFTPLIPLIVMESLRSLADRMDELGTLMGMLQEYQGGNIIFFSLEYGYRNNSEQLSTQLKSHYGQT